MLSQNKIAEHKWPSSALSVLLPHRCVVERSFACAARLPETFLKYAIKREPRLEVRNC